MTDETPIDTAHLRRPLLGIALVLGGVAVVAWWRQAQRDSVLVERTRARLTARPVDAPTESVAIAATHPDLPPPPDPVALRLAPEPVSHPALEAVVPSTPTPIRPQSTEPFSPDLRGLKVG